VAGLGGESGGERRISIVDTYPLAYGMRMRWVRRNIKQRDILPRIGGMEARRPGVQECMVL
jgi:hypothetical protein